MARKRKTFREDITEELFILGLKSLAKGQFREFLSTLLVIALLVLLFLIVAALVVAGA